MGRTAARLVAAVGIVFAVVSVALGGVAGAFYWNHVQANGAEQARRELPEKAKTQIPAILGFDFQTIEGSREAAYRLMTPDFKREYENDTIKNVIPQARDRQIISQVNVVGTGILDAHRDSGSVMVFMNRVITDKSKQPPLYDGSRLKVDYQKIDGEWRISDITPI